MLFFRFPPFWGGFVAMSGVSEILAIAFALVVFFYWFRYNCAVVLRRKVQTDRAREVASANQLSFAELGDRVHTLEMPRLRDAHNALRREYDVLICLLRYTSAIQPPAFTFDQRLLMVDFRIQQWWFTATQQWMTAPARQSVQERISILMLFAHMLGKRTSAVARA